MLLYQSLLNKKQLYTFSIKKLKHFQYITASKFQQDIILVSSSQPRKMAPWDLR